MFLKEEDYSEFFLDLFTLLLAIDVSEELLCSTEIGVTSERARERLGLPSKAKAAHKTVSVQTLASGASWYLKRMGWG